MSFVIHPYDHSGLVNNTDDAGIRLSPLPEFRVKGHPTREQKKKQVAMGVHCGDNKEKPGPGKLQRQFTQEDSMSWNGEVHETLRPEK